MAAYAVVDWLSSEGSLADVAAEIETKLETLDSTSNPIYISQVFPIGSKQDTFQAVIIYAG